MADDDSAQVQYNENLEPLESLLEGVQRPGDFYVAGTLELPMPRVEIDGVGTLSFPVPPEQIRRLVKTAERAPYGRGEETILDTSVRKVWQLPPSTVRISGKSWEQSFQTILSHVTLGLGVQHAKVSAELYKLLVYDEGSFFLAHRDTEKAAGMFGTMVLVLPSIHRGGELLIRHSGREVTVDMSNADISEISYAAFYADCEHEVRPIEEGNRVCLVYNLIQASKKGKPLAAPEYDRETAAVSKLLEKALKRPDAPVKIGYLLEHQYSPDGLSFAGLKNADLARAQVLSAAAVRAGCEVHLGIVHIEESGPAEINYDMDYYGSRRRSYWDSDESEEDEDSGESEDYEAVEVSVSDQYIDQWIDLQDRPIDFGPIPLQDEELFPQGALDGVAPDKQRVTEATGNEGASFERSYHRAALVIWRRDRYAKVLLQAGVGAAIPYLSEQIQACLAEAASGEERAEAIAVAKLIIGAWPEESGYRFGGEAEKKPDRAEMLELLVELGDSSLVERFIKQVLVKAYDGSENAALVTAAQLLGPAKSGELFAHLVAANMKWVAAASVDLLSQFLRHRKPAAKWNPALQKLATAVVNGLTTISEPSKSSEDDYDWQYARESTLITSILISELFEALSKLDGEKLRSTAAETIAAKPTVFDPGTIVVPALSELQERQSSLPGADPALLHLWRHSAEFLLARNEYPPEPPKDWRQDVTIPCSCADCRELQAFVSDPVSREHRFRIRQDRRRHLHEMIERLSLDMTHVTERTGSPQTLVCTKTRRTYLQRCEQFRADVASFNQLLSLMRKRADKKIEALFNRMTATVMRTKT